MRFVACNKGDHYLSAVGGTIMWKGLLKTFPSHPFGVVASGGLENRLFIRVI